MSIKKLKPFITVAGVMLLLAAVTMGYFSAQRLSSIIPASGYEDKGVYSFVPVRVLPVQVENTGATGRARRMNPTKTVYMVDNHSYITIESDETAESYTAELRQKNIMILTFSGIYILLYAATWGVILMKRSRKESPAA